MKIFIIEDEPAIREELVQLLQKYGYQCDSSDDFHHIVQAALSSGANLILLDINLPYQDGFQVCREIRQKSNLPIIVLTSRNSDFDELMSLNIGADDYIAKPYNAQILLARIQKLLARTYEVQDNIVLTHKGLTLNLLKAEISYQGNKKALTKNELGILRLLMVNKGNIIPRDAIIDELWQSEQFIDENTLNVNIVRLRKALTENDEMKEIEHYTANLIEWLETEGYSESRISYGTIVQEIKEVSRSYKEAKMAMDVGKIFFDERRVIAYSELGIGRLIYQLPIPLCKMFIREIFGGKSPDDFDEETLTTISKFFENSLNVSETSRQLFIHRNTLVYRLDKLQKSTGLDIRVFEDAITFKIALMVVKYMKYMETLDY